MRLACAGFLPSFLLLILLLCGLAYWPGLAGDFLFDDYHNLSPMGDYGGVSNWDSLKSFVMNGFAGPTGRPVALASFLLDDNTWPSHAAYFKTTNLFIHLLTGVVLGWLTLLLMRLWCVDEKRASWIALLNMSIWLLHPYMVSTTLYVVQRMAQLSTLFMFSGLLGYLHGRLLLLAKRRLAYLIMSLSLALGTLLAVLSKENGALLPLLVMVVEYCSPKTARGPLPSWRWRVMFLWAPSVLVLGYLASRINFSPDIWPTRPFDQVERLMSQGRILWEYIYYLFVPHVEARGLYQDGYVISRSWFSPVTTFWAALSWGLVFVAALFLRRKWPAFSLAIFFFLAAHLIESSVVGLELYFEHRNYAASAFLFLPLSMFAVGLTARFSAVLIVLVCGIVLAWLALFTWQRATLWGDSERLQNYWAVASPDSPRAQNHLALQLFSQGEITAGLEFLEEAGERLPDSSLLTIQWLLQRVQYELATEADFDLVKARLNDQRFDAQALLGLRMISEKLANPEERSDYRRYTLSLIEAMEQQPHYHRVALFRRLSAYLQGLLLLADKETQEATAQLSLAMKRYADTDTALAIVAHVGSAGYPEEALLLLQQAKELYSKQPVTQLKRSREIYDFEMERLESVLQDDLAALE